MSNIITIKFFDKDYAIPEDVLLYIDFLSFTDSIRDSLLASFVRKIKSNVECIEDEDFLVKEIEQQVGRFIAKLCDYDIYTRTISDYLKDNKGYELFLQTKQKVISQIIAIRSEKLEVYKAGVEDAISRKDSSVTGLDFSIISSSFVNHMIYAYMDASEQTKQERKALETYNREIAELNRQVQTYDRQESSYISGNVIPAMNTVFTFFASELLHRFIADLIDAEKFDRAALKYIDMDRSNDLLKNLALSKNKSAVIENAFVACPFNAAVYMQALENNLLDSDSFQTAKIFKQGEKIISFLRENWGKVFYPDKFQINYQRVESLASFTGEDALDLLHIFTEQFAISVIGEYSRVASMIPDIDLCKRIMADFDETAILSGEAISKGKAYKYVNPIVTADVWKQLTTKCGHVDLLDKIRIFVPADIEVYTKGDIDRYLIEQLFERFESIRVERANRITERIQAEEKARIEAEERAREAARIKEERKKAIIAKIKSIQAKVKDLFEKTKKYIPFACIGIVVFVIAMLIINNVIIPANKYRSAVELMESENYGDASGIFLSLGDYKDADQLLAECEYYMQVEEYDAIYDEAVALMNSGMYIDAITLFESIDGHRDSNELIVNCFNSLYDISYNKALAFMSEGDYETAIEIFEEITHYKDSEAKITECKDGITERTYNEAISLANSGAYKEAIVVLESLGDYKDSSSLIKKYTILGCEKGDIILMGSYEQDNDLTNGPEDIEWLVLERRGNRALVISKYCLEQMPFNDTLTPVTWEDCTIRKWLNNDFIKSAFSKEERAQILSTELSNPDDIEKTESSGNTVDKIFLLSENEAAIYFESDSERKASATEYVSTNHCYWILRTPGSVSNVAHVDYDGTLGYYENVDRNWWIRPAMWIKTTN